MGRYHDAYQKRRWKGPAWGVFFLLVLVLAVGFAMKGCRSGQQAEKAAEPPAETAVTGEVRQTPEPHDYSLLIKKGKFTLVLLDHGDPVAKWAGGPGEKPRTEAGERGYEDTGGNFPGG